MLDQMLVAVRQEKIEPSPALAGRAWSGVAECSAPRHINAGGQSGLRGCKSALRKWQMLRSVGGCGAGAATVRRGLWNEKSGV